MQHSRAKHIEIIHHVFRDHAQKCDITREFVSSKPLSEEKFLDIRRQF